MKTTKTYQSNIEFKKFKSYSIWKRLKEIQVSEILSGIMVILFVYTVISKLSDVEFFKYQLYNQVFSIKVAKALFILLPLSETVTTALLCFNKLRLYGLLCAILLMLAFTIYTALIALGKFDRVPCVCGGVIANMSWPIHLMFNIVFLTIAVIGLLYYLKERRLSNSKN